MCTVCSCSWLCYATENYDVGMRMFVANASSVYTRDNWEINAVTIHALNWCLLLKCSKYVLHTYVTSVGYVAGINQARGHAASEGRMIYSGNVPNRGLT